jgi:hypothetical protein
MPLARVLFEEVSDPREKQNAGKWKEWWEVEEQHT